MCRLARPPPHSIMQPRHARCLSRKPASWHSQRVSRSSYVWHTALGQPLGTFADAREVQNQGAMQHPGGAWSRPTGPPFRSSIPWGAQPHTGVAHPFAPHTQGWDATPLACMPSCCLGTKHVFQSLRHSQRVRHHRLLQLLLRHVLLQCSVGGTVEQYSTKRCYQTAATWTKTYSHTYSHTSTAIAVCSHPVPKITQLAMASRSKLLCFLVLLHRHTGARPTGQ